MQSVNNIQVSRRVGLVNLIRDKEPLNVPVREMMRIFGRYEQVEIDCKFRSILRVEASG